MPSGARRNGAGAGSGGSSRRKQGRYDALADSDESSYDEEIETSSDDEAQASASRKS
jgi:hypothetical protein